MVVDPYYPKVREMAKRWPQEDQASWQKYSRNKSYSLAKYNGCRSCLLWRTFGIALASPIVEDLRLPAWFEMKREFKKSLYHNTDPSKVESNHEARMVDVGLKDANGTIWELRLVWMEYYPEGENLPRVAGKVFARRDPNKRILFHIENEEDCLLSKIVASEDILCAFKDYEQGPVYDWYQFVKNTRLFGDWQFLSLSGFSDQPSFLLAIALHLIRIEWDVDVCSDGSTTTEMVIRLLGKYHQGSVNENNLAAQVLCWEDGVARKLVASYAAEPYLPLSRTDQHNTLGWFTKSLELFVESQRCQENGDAEGARRAMDEFWFQNSDWWHQYPDGYTLVRKIFNYRAVRSISERQYLLENLPKLTFGLETDETVFPPACRSGTKRKAEEVE